MSHSVAESLSSGTVTTNVDKPLWMREKRTRRIKKSKADRTQDERLQWEVPRKTCEEIAPSLLRMKDRRKEEQQKVLAIMKRILKRCGTQKVSKHLQCIVDFDKSESVVPHGQSSKQLYSDIFQARDFDLYGRPIKKKQLSAGEIEAMQRLAQEAGLEFTRQQTKVEDAVYVPNIFDDITSGLTNPVLTTQKWKVGYEPRYNPPVGMAPNPGKLFRSQGNEAYFAYDGEWKDGKMHGYGRYLYDDGFDCRGQFENNWQHGEARADYPTGDSYEGQWMRGKYHGMGAFRTFSGSEYKGEHAYGRRSGFGRVEYPSGLVYEGEWKDGKMHGKGVMTSRQSKFTYEGDFERGSIRGSGVLITPSGERVVRVWGAGRHHSGGDITLPAAVRIFVREKEELEAKYRDEQDRMHAGLRGMQMADYVHTVRTRLHNNRTIEKKRKTEERKAAALEQAAKLREARLRALAGEDSDNEDD